MKDYYIESSNSMGRILMHVGKYKNYREFRKAVNAYINSTCVDNYYREYKMYPKPLQILVGIFSIFGMRIRVKTINDIEKVNLTKYYCRVTELFRTEQDIEKYQTTAA